MGNVCSCSDPEPAVNPELRDYVGPKLLLSQQSDISSNSDNDETVDELPQIEDNSLKKPRISVCAEVYGEHNPKEDFVPPVYEKTAEQADKIYKNITQSCLFHEVDDSVRRILVTAAKRVTFKAKETVISQGEEGNELYLIDTGTADVYKSEPGKQDAKVTELNAGEIFGELALMYNAPRAATVKCQTDLVLWSLDRATFANLVQKAAQERRERYDILLRNVPLLQSIDSYERCKIADVIRIRSYNEGERIIQEGDIGEEFYILNKGTAEATKEDKVIETYEAGAYFGELALLNGAPRAATISATAECEVLYLSNRDFKRLLGPLEGMLRRNIFHYVEVLNKLGISTKGVEGNA